MLSCSTDGAVYEGVSNQEVPDKSEHRAETTQQAKTWLKESGYPVAENDSCDTGGEADLDKRVATILRGKGTQATSQKQTLLASLYEFLVVIAGTYSLNPVQNVDARQYLVIKNIEKHIQITNTGNLRFSVTESDRNDIVLVERETYKRKREAMSTPLEKAKETLTNASVSRGDCHFFPGNLADVSRAATKRAELKYLGQGTELRAYQKSDSGNVFYLSTDDDDPDGGTTTGSEKKIEIRLEKMNRLRKEPSGPAQTVKPPPVGMFMRFKDAPCALALPYRANSKTNRDNFITYLQEQNQPGHEEKHALGCASLRQIHDFMAKNPLYDVQLAPYPNGAIRIVDFEEKPVSYDMGETVERVATYLQTAACDNK